MESNTTIELFEILIGQEKINIPKNINFLELKSIMLHKYKKFVKQFTYNSIKIEERLLVYNYPIFTAIIDRNSFIEYKKRRFRCKRCRKYINLTSWKCVHTASCKAYYLLKLKIPPTFELPCGYDEEENMTKEIYKEADDFLYKKFESHRQSMLKKINKILYQ